MSTTPRKASVNWPILIVGFVVTGLMVAVLGSGFGNDPMDMFENRIEVATPFDLRKIDSGEQVKLADLKGQTVVLNFWATWCQPCKIEHPHVLRAAQQYQPKGVAFLGVLHDDDPLVARQYLKREGQVFPSVFDPRNRVSIDYGVSGVPETFVIDKDGYIVKKFVGPVRPGDIEAVLEGLL
ncbi:MAG: TlpA disulfide reductase family protein [Myxococcota bacterium]